ncbi:MAG: leucine-rich repeat protein [Candidatus Borkfalkiaceae bacterium]|nr:leucine-rich repeat protein [Christensenellaceae bacterium]
MKKKLSILLLLCIVCVALVLGTCGIFGGKKHTHSYVKTVTTDAYLCSSATCTKKATYYYSCECGERSTDTFEYGEYSDHTYSSEWSSDESKHWHASTCIHHVRKGEESHKFKDNICTKCKYKKIVEDKVIDVSSITLNKSELSIRAGESTDFIATVLPDNATDKTVIWSSSSPSVVTVENGKVTAIAKGTAIITASSGKLSATCAIEVVEDFLFTPMGNSYAVSAYVGEDNVVAVPDTYNGKPVTMIGERAFYDCSQITEIILPSSIKEIGVEAFGYCISLAKIEIVACTRLRDKAFIGCTALTEIYLPDGLVSIGTAPFTECTSLTKVTIESGSVSNSVFAGNKYVKEIVLCSGVSEIGQNAFKGCSSLESLTIPRVDENNKFGHYYFGVSTYKYTMQGSDSNNLYPEEVKAYTVKDSNGVTRVFGLPLDGTDW